MLLVGSETLVENQQLEPLSMLGNKAHVNCTNWDGRTALHLAVSAGHLNVVEKLVMDFSALFTVQDRTFAALVIPCMTVRVNSRDCAKAAGTILKCRVWHSLA